MGDWEVKVITSEKKDTRHFNTRIVGLLKKDWTIAGYSVDDWYHNVLLIRKMKESKD